MRNSNRPSLAEILADIDPPRVSEEPGSVKRARELLAEIAAAKAMLEWHIRDPMKTFVAEGPVIGIIGGLGEVLFLALAENKSTRPGIGKAIRRTKSR